MTQQDMFVSYYRGWRVQLRKLYRRVENSWRTEPCGFGVTLGFPVGSSGSHWRKLRGECEPIETLSLEEAEQYAEGLVDAIVDSLI